MIKVSVIIPVYNAEKFLEKCLNSIINQTLKDIEIIVVDDGSTDNSYNILSEYAKNDNRIILLRQENAKQGAARNRGLEIAKGEFITFVDADDWIEPDYFELLYNAAQKYGVNIAASSTTRDYKHKVKNHLKLKEERVYDGVNSVVKALEYNLITHSKLYRFEPIKALRFEENILYEDAPYTLKAIISEKSMVTVPGAHYHYFSNPTSTIKQKYGIKLENDKIKTQLELINIAKENDVALPEQVIIKKCNFIFKTKYYMTHKDFYILGIKVWSKKEVYNNEKVFLVFNTACFGDVLLCNSLVQNIKNVFPESRVIFVCDKNWEDIAKYQDGVDEVVICDKRGVHKGILGVLKFVREFKYKKPFASMLTYFNIRNLAIAWLLKSRFVLKPLSGKEELNIQFRHAKLLQTLTNKPIINYPIKYNLPNDIKNPITEEKYITMCCITKNPIKDMPVDTAMGIIEFFNTQTDYKVVLTGRGDNSAKYAEALEKKGANFVNLVNKTSLLELGAVLKGSKGLISCDTGTMHYGYSMGIPTIGIFYQPENVPVWAPRTEVYNNVLIISENQTAENIFNRSIKFMKDCEEIN